MNALQSWGSSWLAVWPTMVCLGIIDYVADKWVFRNASRMGGELGYYAASGALEGARLLAWDSKMGMGMAGG